MPCILCIAVFAMLAGAITTTVLDLMASRLTELAVGPVQKTSDTESVTRFDFEVAPPVSSHGASVEAVPVAVTVLKDHKRVRIQVLTHAISRATAEEIEDRIAAALDLRIVSRQDAHVEEHPQPGAPLAHTDAIKTAWIDPNVARS